MTEVLHSSPSMPISSVQHSMKRLVDEMEFSNNPIHTSPVDLLAQYTMGSPLAKKPRLDGTVSPPFNEHSTPIKNNCNIIDNQISPVKSSDLNNSFNSTSQSGTENESAQNESRDEHSFNVPPRHENNFNTPPEENSFNIPRSEDSFNAPQDENSFNEMREENSFNDSRDENSLNDSTAEDYAAPVRRPFPCVWLNNDGTERSNSPDIVSVVPEAVVDEGVDNDSYAPIVVVPSEEPRSPSPDGKQLPCVWVGGEDIRPGSKSPLSMVRCEPTMPEETDSPSLVKHGDVPSPDKFNFKPNGGGGALSMLPMRMPMEAASPPRPNLLSAGMLPTMVMTGQEQNEEGHNMEVCPECNKVFKRKVYLQRHMEREHWSTAKVFKCDDCAYETKHQSNLSVHRRIHTGERPYHCGLCGQRYTQGHLLKSHIRSRHGGNMEFYNLDKKSESTRGRKSLDPKQEGRTHDKISSLLAQHTGLPHPNKLNPLLPPFMNGIAPFPLRPLMQPPIGMPNMPPSLMGGPRLFSLPGLNSNPMMPNLSRGISQPMHLPPLPLPPLNSIPNESRHSGLKIPLKVPTDPPQSDDPLKLTIPKPMSPPNYLGIKKEPGFGMFGNDMAPEDLSTGRKTLSPDSGIRSPATPTSETHAALPTSGSDKASIVSNSRSSPYPAIINSFSPSTTEEKPLSPEELPLDRPLSESPKRESASPLSAVPSRLIENRKSETPERNSITPDRMSSTPIPEIHKSLIPTSRTMTPEMLLAAASMAGKMPMPMPYPHYIQALARGELLGMTPSPEPVTPTQKSHSPSPCLDECFPSPQTVLSLGLQKQHQKAVCHEQNCHDKCSIESCPHANKLRKLRKNIMRMLSVLSPELGVEGCLDYNTDEVDEMLHEVIYSNIDDEQPSGRKKS